MFLLNCRALMRAMVARTQAGYPNPLVSIHIFSLTHYLSLPRSSSASSLLTLTLPFTDLPAADTVITEVAWVSDEQVLLRVTDREARRERVVLWDLEGVWVEGREGAREVRGRVVRDIDWVKRDGGWAEAVSRDCVASPSFPVVEQKLIGEILHELTVTNHRPAPFALLLCSHPPLPTRLPRHRPLPLGLQPHRVFLAR